MIKNYFSSPIYKTNNKSLINNFMSTIDDRKFKKHFDLCNVAISPIDDNNRDIEFNSFLYESLLDYFDQLEIGGLDDYKLDIQYWLNKYETGAYQEPHNHICTEPYKDELVSFCYMLHVPEDSGTFKIINPNFRNTKLDQLTKQKMAMSVGCKDGDLIIFPSHLLHFVSINNSEKTRITLAGNVSLVRK